MELPRSTERRLQIVGVILILALLIEAVSMIAHGAIAFLVFVGAAFILVCIGVPAYLLTLVHKDSHR